MHLWNFWLLTPERSTDPLVLRSHSLSFTFNAVGRKNLRSRAVRFLSKVTFWGSSQCTALSRDLPKWFPFFPISSSSGHSLSDSDGRLVELGQALANALSCTDSKPRPLTKWFIAPSTHIMLTDYINWAEIKRVNINWGLFSECREDFGCCPCF